MRELLTLAMAETTPHTGEFVIVAYDLSKKQLLSLNINRQDILLDNGQALWDISAVTRVENLELNGSNENQVFHPMGATQLVNYQPLKNTKELLEKLSINSADFFENQKKKYAVLKVKQVIQMAVKENNRFYLTFNYEGSGSTACQEALNKDYRWVKYWQWANQRGLFQEKSPKYIDLLNRKSKTFYLLLHRHYFPNGPKYWICGTHWL